MASHNDSGGPEEASKLRKEYIDALKSFNWVYHYTDEQYWDVKYWELLIIMQKLPIDDARALWKQYAHGETNFPESVYHDRNLINERPVFLSVAEKHERRERQLEESYKGRLAATADVDLEHLAETGFLPGSSTEYGDVERRLASLELSRRRRDKVRRINSVLLPLEGAVLIAALGAGIAWALDAAIPNLGRWIALSSTTLAFTEVARRYATRSLAKP